MLFINHILKVQSNTDVDVSMFLNQHINSLMRINNVHNTQIVNDTVLFKTQLNYFETALKWAAWLNT